MTMGKAALGLPFEVSGSEAMAAPKALGPIQVSAPAANGYVARVRQAKLKSSRNGTVTVCHREYVTDVLPLQETEGAFQLLVSHHINPGNPLLFPWLSEIATRFESYKFSKLRFVYEPQSPTSSAGTVMMVTDYDEADSAPLSKTQFMAFKGGVRSPPWFTCAFEADPSDLNKRSTYFVRNSSQAATGNDSRLFDTGQFYLAYEGDTAAGGFSAGELYVDYEVTLMTPALESSALSGAATYDNPSSPITSTNTIATSLKTTGPNPPIVVASASDTGSLFFTPSVPGLYLASWFLNITDTITGGSQLNWAVPSGSNAVLGPYTFESSNQPAGAVGPFYWTSRVVRFPNSTDMVQLYGGGFNLGTVGVQQFILLLTPISEDTQGSPAPVAVDPRAIQARAMVRRLDTALARLTLHTQGEKRPARSSSCQADECKTSKQTVRFPEVRTVPADACLTCPYTKNQAIPSW